jgi:major vault protein
MAGEAGQLILAQNQYALVQDSTNGAVRVSAGPHTQSLSGQEKPVIYDSNKDKFIQVAPEDAIKQNPLVPEGHYLVLENPAFDDKGALRQPKNAVNSPVELTVGRKIVIPGPYSAPLFPGQTATAIPGHHLRSNQYLVVRVYNADEATKNAPDYLKEAAKAESKATAVEGALAFTTGQQLVIKGTEVPFFIPPTGFEVLKEKGENGNNEYVREAMTLERLEYAILLDEDGNKRFENGPKVVFPEATERFFVKDNQKKFKALELNDQMGLFIKVIAEKEAPGVPVPQGAKEGDEFVSEKFKAKCVVRKAEESDALVAYFKVGEELFLTGKEQRIYYPCAEFALIEYDDPTKGYKRQRYYGITLPEGEGRYVLDKTAGHIKKEVGPMIFLPDPRNEVIIRRVLDERTVSLWYPGNTEALAFNRSLTALAEKSTSYLAEDVVLTAAADAATSRGLNRGTSGSKSLLAASSYEGDTMRRGTQFTPPPTLTLSTKYDGIPSINVFNGYAVQVTNKKGDSRIVVGNASILLEYDETLTVLELSTGTPKNTNNKLKAVYLQVDHNLISDIIQVETKDMVKLNLKVSYRVNFLREHKEKWFSIENYVKYLCDHMRSLLKATIKKNTLKEMTDDGAAIIRDIVLGAKNGDATRHRLFAENGMDVYDVEVLEMPIANEKVKAQVENYQIQAVTAAISMATSEQTLENTRRRVEIDEAIAKLETDLTLAKKDLEGSIANAENEAAVATIEAEVEMARLRLEAVVAQQDLESKISASKLERVKATDDYALALEKERTELFVKKIEAVSPNLIAAMNNLADSSMMTQLMTALAPLAIADRDSINNAMEKVFAGTPMATVLANVQSRGVAKAKAATA